MAARKENQQTPSACQSERGDGIGLSGGVHAVRRHVPALAGAVRA